MDKVRRILVHVCTDRAAPQQAHFLQVTFWVTANVSEPCSERVWDKSHFVLSVSSSVV